MKQKINARSEAGLWMERIVWNAAAGAVLASMILVLLGSLRWLDAVAPATVSAGPVLSDAASVDDANDSNSNRIDESIWAAGLDRPSG